jgi:uncharacterized protein DUF4019
VTRARMSHLAKLSGDPAAAASGENAEELCCEETHGIQWEEAAAPCANQAIVAGAKQTWKGHEMRPILVCMSLAAIVSCVGCGSVSNPEAEKAAIASAESWLALVDVEQYAESWSEAAQFFKGAISEEKWVETMEAVRKPFGGNISREVKSKRYRTSMPGAPDGEYVVIQFRASFENKKSAIETITPMLDKDGKWRVSGYFMK